MNIKNYLLSFNLTENVRINSQVKQCILFKGADARLRSGGYSLYATHPFVYYVWDKENQIPIISGHIKHFEIFLTM